LIGVPFPDTTACVKHLWHIADRARLRERFFGAARTVLARL